MNLTDLINDEYAKVKEQKIIPPNKSTPKLEELMKIYLHWKKTIEKHNNETFEKSSYLTSRRQIRESKIDYATQDIDFFLSYISYQDTPFEELSYSGIFISALINHHFWKTKQKENYLIIMNSVSELIVDFLCYKNNGANVHIEGNVGGNLCSHMRKGTVTVNGNAGFDVGEYMKGGTLHAIFAEEGFGHHMTGGKIILDKNNEDTNVCRYGGEVYCNKRRVYPI